MGRIFPDGAVFQEPDVMVLAFDQITHEVTTLADAAPIVRDLCDVTTLDKLRARDARLKLGWVLFSLKSEFGGAGAAFDNWVGSVGMKRRTAYHLMRVSLHLADSAGRFDADKYRAMCRARKRSAGDPAGMTLRQIEIAAGLRPDDDEVIGGCAPRCTESTDGSGVCAPRCTIADLVARGRLALDALESRGVGERRVVVDAVRALEAAAGLS